MFLQKTALILLRVTVPVWATGKNSDWIVNTDGSIALRGNNGRYVSCENGHAGHDLQPYYYFRLGVVPVLIDIELMDQAGRVSDGFLDAADQLFHDTSFTPVSACISAISLPTMALSHRFYETYRDKEETVCLLNVAGSNIERGVLK